jgi:hypothetical protein
MSYGIFIAWLLNSLPFAQLSKKKNSIYSPNLSFLGHNDKIKKKKLAISNKIIIFAENISNMIMEILQGTEKRLYDLVAPLVLNPSVIRQNGGFAFKTTPKHTWIVSVAEDGNCVGFLPIQIKNNICKVNNYYIKNRNEDVFSSLLKKALEYAKKQKFEALDIIAQTEDYPTIQRHGLSPETKFVNYTRFRKQL